MPGQTIACRIAGYISMIMALLLFSAQTVADSWKEVAPGIAYLDLNANLLSPWSHIHVFRVNPEINKLDIAAASDYTMNNASVDALAHRSKALIAINGGFFDEQYHPLGLRIRNFHQHSPLKKISWWGIFYIRHNKPWISSVNNYHSDDHTEFAIQSGPRLIVQGKIPSLRPGYAERSALGITRDGQIIILVTSNYPLSTSDLAQLMKSPLLNCQDALNLDGGSSSQLSANMGLFQINVHGFSNISDAIIVRKRQAT